MEFNYPVSKNQYDEGETPQDEVVISQFTIPNGRIPADHDEQGQEPMDDIPEQISRIENVPEDHHDHHEDNNEEISADHFAETGEFTSKMFQRPEDRAQGNLEPVKGEENGERVVKKKTTKKKTIHEEEKEVKKVVKKKKKTVKSPPPEGEIDGNQGQDEADQDQNPVKRKATATTKLPPLKKGGQKEDAKPVIPEDKSDHTTQYSSNYPKRSVVIVDVPRDEIPEKKKGSQTPVVVKTSSIVDRLESMKKEFEDGQVVKPKKKKKKTTVKAADGTVMTKSTTKKGILKKKGTIGTKQSQNGEINLEYAKKTRTLVLDEGKAPQTEQEHDEILMKSSQIMQITPGRHLKKNFSDEQPGQEFEMALNPWNLVALIKSGKVSRFQKYIAFASLFAFTIQLIINFVTFIMYMTSGCSITDQFFQVENFIIAILARLGIMNFALLEITGFSLFNIPVPLLIPIASLGSLPVLQMAPYIYDTTTCSNPNKVFSMEVASVFSKMNGAAGLAAIALFIVISMCFSRCVLPNKNLKMVRTGSYIVLAGFVAAYNFMFLLLSFGEVSHFMPILLVDNLVYWGLAILSAYLYWNIRTKGLNYLNGVGTNIHTEVKSPEFEALPPVPAGQHSPPMSATSDRRMVEYPAEVRIDVPEAQLQVEMPPEQRGNVTFGDGKPAPPHDEVEGEA